ncbi:putative membrane protein, partial [Vibrio parahaemolyticus VPTS-2010_2]
TRGQ